MCANEGWRFTAAMNGIDAGVDSAASGLGINTAGGDYGAGQIASIVVPGPGLPGKATRVSRFIVTSGGVTIDRLAVNMAVSSQRQARHVLGAAYRHGGYFHSASDAQRVLDEFHSGAAQVIGTTKSNYIVVRSPTVTGFNHNVGPGYLAQPTDVFFIKGSSTVSVVPANPGWKQ